jgi:hypothetical protein
MLPLSSRFAIRFCQLREEHAMRLRLMIILTTLMIVASVSVAQAQGILDGESCHVDADTTVSGNLFVLCGELLVEGVVKGSILGGARVANITGTVEGSIYLLGGELNVAGNVGKDIHFGGISLKVTEQATLLSDTGSIITATLSNDIQAGSVIPGHITSIGYQLVVSGDVLGEINFWGSALNIRGDIGQDVTATVGNSESGGASSQIETLLIPFQVEVQLVDPGLILYPDGNVRGTLDYTGPTQGVVDGTIEGTEIFNPTIDPLLGTPAEQSARSIGLYLRVVMREFSSLVFVGIMCVLFIPRHVQAPIRTMQTHPVSTLGIGLLSFIMSFPIVLICALLSVGLIILLATLRLDNVVLFTGIVLGLTNVGAASIFYFMAIYIARIVVALAIGRLVLWLGFRARDDGTWRYTVICMVIGVFALSLMGAIPVIGIGLNAAVLFFGLGAILSVLRSQYIKLFRTPHPPTPITHPVSYTPDFLPHLPYLSDEAANFPPPLVDDDQAQPGTDNLPSGFNWWQSDYDD